MARLRILNQTNGYEYKLGRVERAIEECSVAWVEVGVSVRNLTYAEAIVARSEQVKVSVKLALLREPLPSAEIPDVLYEPSFYGTLATRNESRLIREANYFVMECAAGLPAKWKEAA